MFKLLTVRLQLFLGFGIILALSLISAVIISQIVSNTYHSFDRYREMARDANLMGRVQANLLLTRTFAKDYFSSSEFEDTISFQHYYERMRSFIDEAQIEINDPQRAQSVDKIDDETQRYYKAFLTLVDYSEQRNKLINNELELNGARIRSQIEAIQTELHKAYNAKDYNINNVIDSILNHFLSGQLSAIEFLYTHDEAYYIDSIKYFDLFNFKVNHSTSIIEASAYKDQVKSLVHATSVYQQSLINTHNLTIKRNNIIDLLNTLGPEISQIAENVKLEVKSVQDTLGPEMVKQNKASFSYIIGLAVFLFIITLIIAIHIPKVIVSSLDELKSGVLSLLAFLRQEQESIDPIVIEGNNEFAQIADVLNQNIAVAQLTINKNKLAEQEKNEALRELAITDGLTGLYNRHYFDELAVAAFNRAKRFDNYLIFYILDIDHFKLYNDNYGHPAGDLALQTVANTIKEHLQRNDDLIFRLGGEEFGGFAVSKKKALTDDLHYLQKLCSLVEQLRVPHGFNTASEYLTISMGIRIVAPEEDKLVSLDQAYEEADIALYQAKDTGRNNVVVFNQGKR